MAFNWRELIPPIIEPNPPRAKDKTGIIASRLVHGALEGYEWKTSQEHGQMPLVYTVSPKRTPLCMSAMLLAMTLLFSPVLASGDTARRLLSSGGRLPAQHLSLDK
jgi:hypothetical protein